MKKILSYTFILLVLVSCGRHESSYKRVTVPSQQGGLGESLLPVTPIKNQGKTELCWAYAMLATIETDRIAMGDSVNLSPLWLERMSLEEQAADAYFSGRHVSLRGTLPEAMRLIETYGIVSWDAYHTDGVCGSSRVSSRRVEKLTHSLSAQRAGLQRLKSSLQNVLDDDLGPQPRRVYMLGAEYTPLEFAHSVAMPGEWQAYTSFTHHPFYRPFAVEVPDNSNRDMAMNVPIMKLYNMVIESLRHRHPVAWEGCMRMEKRKMKTENHSIQNKRQQLFERHILTDDHCMAIIGRYKGGFICKNSWGVEDGNHGFRYMSDRQFLLSTIMVMIKK